MMYKFYRLYFNILKCGFKLKFFVKERFKFNYGIKSKFILNFDNKDKFRLVHIIKEKPKLTIGLLHETNLTYVPYITLDNKRYVTLDDKVYYVKKLIYE